VSFKYPHGGGGFTGTHRYLPKLSADRVAFHDLESDRIQVSETGERATFSLKLRPSPMWV
jgi:hypothetical protein